MEHLSKAYDGHRVYKKNYLYEISCSKKKGKLTLKEEQKNNSSQYCSYIFLTSPSLLLLPFSYCNSNI